MNLRDLTAGELSDAESACQDLLALSDRSKISISPQTYADIGTVLADVHMTQEERASAALHDAAGTNEVIP